jgi:multisubunit Na+/H+ antiporter MnhC subunit
VKGGAILIARFTLGALLVALLAAGIPLAWVWVGSQVQGGTEPSATAIATVVAGCLCSYAVVALIAAWLKGRGDVASAAQRHERYAWNRSMRDEAKTPRQTNFLENVLIITTIVVALVVTVWFFLYGSPGVPQI